MPSLRVLNLTNNYSLKELPSGISNLISLEHLELSRTGLLKLPEEMKALINLKYLSLDSTFYLRTFPRQIISSLLMLRILAMVDCGVFAEATEDGVLFDDGESLIEELLCLKHLNVLSITLRNASSLQKLSSSHKFQSCCGRLCLRDIEDSRSLDVLSLAAMKNLRTLVLRSCDFKELESTDGAGKVQKTLQFHVFSSLHRVQIARCHEFKDMTWLTLAPNLKMVQISNCGEMEELINGEMLANLIPFPELQFLELQNVPKLKSIYCSALPFLRLKEIVVYGCPELKKLPLDCSSAKERKIVIKGEKRWWKKLQWEDEATQNVFASCFKFIEDDWQFDEDDWRF